MATMTQTSPRVKPSKPFRAYLILNIAGTDYAVERIDAGECGVAALRLVKSGTDDVYDLLVDHAGQASCSCPDWVVRHADHGTHCKHLKAARLTCLLDAPEPRIKCDNVTLNPPAPGSLDDFIARTRGPVAPAVEPAPVQGDRVTLNDPAPLAERVARVISGEAERVPGSEEDEAIRQAAQGPVPLGAESWGAWSDCGTWELGPESDNLSETPGPACCPPDEAVPCGECLGKTATFADLTPAEPAAESANFAEILDDEPTGESPKFGDFPDTPRLTLPSLIELHASAFRSWGTDAGDLMADTLADLARRVRLLHATTPAGFRDREDAMLA